MVAAYLRERYRLRLFVPLAAAIAAAGSGGRPGWPAVAADTAFALLLLFQFRAWDDLADRDHDARVHPQRVLSRAPEVTPLIGCCGGIAIFNLCIAVWRDATGLAVGTLAALDALFGAWYLARGARTAAGDHLLLAKYPAMVFIVAGARSFEAPVLTVVGAATLYLAVCAYEVWHDPASPMARRFPTGGHS